MRAVHAKKTRLLLWDANCCVNFYPESHNECLKLFVVQLLSTKQWTG